MTKVVNRTLRDPVRFSFTIVGKTESLNGYTKRKRGKKKKRVKWNNANVSSH